MNEGRKDLEQCCQVDFGLWPLWGAQKVVGERASAQVSSRLPTTPYPASSESCVTKVPQWAPVRRLKCYTQGV